MSDASTDAMTTGRGEVLVKLPGWWMEKHGLTVGSTVHVGVSIDGTIRYHLAGNRYRKPYKIRSYSTYQAAVAIPKSETDSQRIGDGAALQMAEDKDGSLIVSRRSR